MGNDVRVIDENPLVSPTDPGNQIPVQPTGSMLKEQAPIGAGLPELKPSGPEVKHNIGQESAELGVQEIQDMPDLTEGIDMRHAGTSVPVPSGPTGKVSLPMSEEEIANQLKTGQDDDSGKWLAGLIKKVIAVMGL